MLDIYYITLRALYTHYLGWKLSHVVWKPTFIYVKNKDTYQPVHASQKPRRHVFSSLGPNNIERSKTRNPLSKALIRPKAPFWSKGWSAAKNNLILVYLIVLKSRGASLPFWCVIQCAARIAPLFWPEEYINRSLRWFMQITSDDCKCSIIEFGQILYILNKTVHVLASYLCLS